MTTNWRQLWRALRGLWLVAVLAIVAGLAVHGWSALLQAEDLRLPPAFETCAWVSAAVGMGILVWAMVRGIRQIAVARGSRWGWRLAGVAAVHLGLVFGTPLAIVASDPWLFNEHPIDALTSPGGARYHLYAGLLCIYQVRVREPGSLYLQPVARLSPRVCPQGPRLAWDRVAGRPVVVDRAGKPVTSGVGKAFDWRPH